MDDPQNHTTRIRQAAVATSRAEADWIVARRERDQAVHAARAAGLTWEQIGKALGVSRQRALAIGQRSATHDT